MTSQTTGHPDPKEVARKVQEMVQNPPPEVVERMRRSLQKRAYLLGPPDIDKLMFNRY